MSFPEELLTSIEGAIGLGECRLLYNEAAKVPKEKVIVEIGSWRGRSTCALALGSMSGNRARVYSIDPHEKFDSGRGLICSTEDWKVWAENVTRAECWEVVRPIGLPSSEAMGLGFIKPSFSVGLLFIDGDHSYEAVRDDLWIAHSCCVDMIVLDDWQLPGVRHAIDGFTSDQFSEQGTMGSLAILERADG